MTTTTEHQEDLGIEPGVFALPTPESLQAPTVTGALKGASQAAWDESDDESQDFPMIVWLRGEEPWFTQFDMDADAVMSALGIKRSRLTQISGKELRVGRVRMDRYIRPVYRSLDVEQYLKWTRATASHQKSSDAIKLAVDQLQLQSESIQNTLQSLTSSFTDSLKAELRDFIAESVASGISPMAESLQTFRDDITSLTSRLNATVTGSTESLKMATDAFTGTITDVARQQAAAIEVLTLQLNQMSEKTALMEERMSAWENMLSANIKTIATDVASLKKTGRFEKSIARKPKRQPENQGVSAAKPKLVLRAAPSRRKPSRI
jgi:methyl-accepting chemotaxis protein